ncbi:MAG: ATP-dependent DNA helicase RecG [Actinobacteria bacterium]|nr:ATP-dependent DNA helicase RecG [Actinomycetota bacterium]
MANLETKLIDVIGDRSAKVVASELGYKTVGDFLHHYPRRYVRRGELTNIAELREGEEATVLAKVHSVKSRRMANRKQVIVEVIIEDNNREKMSLTFFNQAWREKEMRIGRQGLFAGKIGTFKGARQLAHPELEWLPGDSDVEDAIESFADKYLPIYPATGKFPSWKIAKSLEIVLDSLDQVEDFLPETIREQYEFPNLFDAFKEVHRPTDIKRADLARARLTFDEAFLLQLTMLSQKREQAKIYTVARIPKEKGVLAEFDKSLPFQLTPGQISVSEEIFEDLLAEHPMHRLLQGEVGSGKTIVALRSALNVIDASAQVAFLAPTEVLAQQHYRTIKKQLGELATKGELGAPELAINVALLTGSMSQSEKRETQARIKSGEVDLVVGTHALLSEAVEFKDLGLVIVDEQHRFGVEQRDALRAKAKTPPHLLVMTATPIPRTVAITVFGDLDISTLSELPLGRTPITTHLVNALSKPNYLERAWQRIKEEVSAGHQAYVVAPRISAGNSEDIDMDFLFGTESKEMAAVTELAPELATGVLKGLRVAQLHGKQNSDEKEATMQAFSAKEIDVLVATTVIEVGVDVPNATVMVIMDADRFGISQLHQLRGRIGRGQAPGLCLLITKVPENSLAFERLNAVANTLDGFELARIDLDQRREGDVLGVSQSGTRSHLKLLRVLRDEEIIIKARSAAEITLDTGISPTLAREISKLLAEREVEFLDKG